MRIAILAAAAAFTFMPAVPAFAAQSTLEIGFAKTDDAQPSEPRWVVCYTWDAESDQKYVGPIHRVTAADVDAANAAGDPNFGWREFLEEKYSLSNRLFGACNIEKSQNSANWRYNLFRRNNSNSTATLVEVDWPRPATPTSSAAAKQKPPVKRPESKPDQTANQSSAESAREAEQARIAAREERARREAEWQAELDKYAADKRAWEAKVAAQKAEEERQKAAHVAAQEAADRAKAAHEAKMAEHRRKQDEYARIRAENAALLARHAACTSGDRQACADIAASKPAMGDDLASNEEPKTSDDDARTCVSRPVVSASDTFKGQTAAVVFNGCKTAVDVRVCLLRSGGWNCGVKWGLQPQDRWTHTSFETQGEIFWDARMAGSSEPLASPGDE